MRSWGTNGNTQGTSHSAITGAITSALNDCVSVKVFYFSSSGALTTTITDSMGNVYGAPIYNEEAGTDNWYLAWFVLPGIQGFGSGHTFTSTFGTFVSQAIAVDGYSGRATSNVIDASSVFVRSGGGGGTGFTGTTIPASGNTLAGDDIEGAICADGAVTWSSSGFTISQQGSTAANWAVEYLNNQVAGTYAAAFTASAAGKRAVVLTAALAAMPATLAGNAVAACVATGSMSAASVMLATPLYTGIGGILDPNFWFDAMPGAGTTVFYDATHITILSNGEINSNSNNCSASVQFVDSNGNLATGLVVFPGTMVGYAVSAATPAGVLQTFSVPTYTLDSTFIINILPRIFTVSGPAVQRFDVKDPAESVNLAFNFTLGLTGGITLQGTPTVSVSVSSGVDPNPNALMNGPPGLDATKSYVIQPVTGGLNGVEYEWVASCQTRDPNTVLAVAGILPVKR